MSDDAKSSLSAVTNRTRLFRTADACALVTIAIGVLVLSGWLLDIEPLKHVLPGLVAMKFNTALTIMLAGAALWWRQRSALRLTLGALVAMFGALTLGEHLSGGDWGIDQLFFHEAPGALAITFPPGRMAPSTSVCFLLCGVALMCSRGSKWSPRGGSTHAVEVAPGCGHVVDVLAFGVAAIAGFVLISYATGAESLRHLPGFISMALNTAGAFVLLAVGILCTVPEGVMAQAVHSRDTGRTLWLGFGLLTILLATLGVAVAVRLKSVGEEVDAQTRFSRPRIVVTRELEMSVLAYGLGVHQASAGDAQAPQRASADATEVERWLAEYDSLAQTHRERELATRLAAHWRELCAQGQALLANGAPPGRPALERFAALGLGLKNFLDQEMQPEALAAHDSGQAAVLRNLRNTEVLVQALLVLGVLIALVTSKLVGRAVLGQVQALRASEERFRSVVENTSEGLVLFDPQGNLIYQNAASLRIHGFSVGEDGCIVHGDLPATWQVWDAQGRSIGFDEWPVSRVFRGERFQNHVLHVLRPETGLEFDASYNGCPIHDDAGRLVLGFVTIREITEQRKAETALSASEEKYRNLFVNMTEEVHFWKLVRDEKGEIKTWRLVDANPPTLKTWGNGSVDEIRGKTTDEIFGPGATEHFMPVVRKIMTEGVPHSFEDFFPNLDRHFRFTSVPVGEYFITTGADITALKKAQEALRAVNESLEQRVAERTAEVRQQADQLRALAAELTQVEQRERKRLARILHDHIQQLLVAARMQMEWLHRDSRPERLQVTMQGVDSILKEALDASRSLTVELSPPILHEAGLIGGLNWLAARTLQRNQFEVVLRAENKAEPSTEDVRLLLFECAREVVLNAVKHSGVSQAHVTLLRTNDGYIKLIVSDEGKGFDPDLLHKRRPDEASFGLFSIQQRLIHYGGRMEIGTAPGKGTRVTMTLPAGEALPLAEEPSRTACDPAKPDSVVVREKTARRRVLIVDDHKIMREGLVSIMQFESDLEVVGQAADGLSAVELASKLHPDVVIMDINLGEGINGVEATKRILSANPTIKVIGLSMHTDSDVATALRDAGAVAYVTKGGPSEDLIAAIRAACAV